ncbi:MAG: N-(5'-phosphoribosyl)anthranilate isomerase [Paracoccaceae bacterium]|nr:N-(5'-phosphoribosyl)anthranilate isomerase [Paracoccaceae bacterium]
MTSVVPHIHQEAWLETIFSSRNAIRGGVIRRQTSDIHRIVGRDRFLAELERRGYRAVENAGQTIIFCNAEPIRVLR